MPKSRLARLSGILLSILAACSSGSNAGGTGTSLVPPTADITLAGVSGDAEEALARVDQYFSAVNEGRVDDLGEIFGMELTEAERRSFEFHRILISNGYPWEVESCEAVHSGATTVHVECNVTNTDPVFTATGASQVTAPFMFGGGVLLEQGWVPKGAGFSAPLGSYVTYLKTFHSADYDQCAPHLQTGPFESHGGIARIPECGLVLAAHGADVAEWVEAGKPAT